eukprot:m.140870 g.140870  ORF g.140870 m.140870 type:complete len:615 (+) comp17096_c0_seq1:507-2351(+)
MADTATAAAVLPHAGGTSGAGGLSVDADSPLEHQQQQRRQQPQQQRRQQQQQQLRVPRAGALSCPSTPYFPTAPVTTHSVSPTPSRVVSMMEAMPQPAFAAPASPGFSSDSDGDAKAQATNGSRQRRPRRGSLKSIKTSESTLAERGDWTDHLDPGTASLLPDDRQTLLSPVRLALRTELLSRTRAKSICDSELTECRDRLDFAHGGRLTLLRDAKRVRKYERLNAIGSRTQAMFELLRSVFSREVIQRYEMLKLLGHGNFGTVLLVRDRVTGEEHALKAIRKSKVTSQTSLRNETDAMARAQHPSIVKMHRRLEDKNYVYLILEYCPGGELLDLLVEEINFPESIAAFIMDELLQAVAYLHSRRLVHRDLKPDNVLLMDRQNIYKGIRIADFGIVHLFPVYMEELDRRRSLLVPGASAQGTTTPSPAKGHVRTLSSEGGGGAVAAVLDEIEAGDDAGTLHYMAPEVLKGQKYGYAVDVWAAGVIFFNLLSGDYPFDSENEQELARKIAEAKLDLSHPGWGGITSDCKDLLRQLLEPAPALRLTAEAALQHPWLQQHRRLRHRDRNSSSVPSEPAAAAERKASPNPVASATPSAAIGAAAGKLDGLLDDLENFL